METLKIYLCDLTHTTQGYGSELVPYAIGCIAAGLDEYVCLFKDPALLNAAFKDVRPDIVGFSNYMWNTNLSCAIAKEIKDKYPDILIVFGGPNFPLRTDGQRQWLRDRPYIDLYIAGEGETPFAQVVQEFKWHHDIGTTQLSDIYGVCSVVEGDYHKVLTQWPDGIDNLPREEDLGFAISPYLNGSLDEFLADPKLIPILECNRGCPFTCTFCVDGTKSRCKVEKHTTERMLAELEYIARRTQAKTLFLADCNFGMYAEDVEFSLGVQKIKEKYGYPQYINASTGKNKKERIIEVANNLQGSLRVAASLQSMDEEVLENIKRTNIDKDTLSEIVLSLPDANTYSELILGLPGDTAEKHKKAVCELIDMGYDQIRMHQLTLLPGSVLDTQREEFGLKTNHRVLQRSFGVYPWGDKSIQAIETEEVVTSSNTFSGYRTCRMFALSVVLLHNERAFYELAQFIRMMGYKYSSFVSFAHDHIMKMPVSNPMACQYDRFYQQMDDELMDNPEGNMDDLLAGRTGNNLLFNTQGHILYHQYADLNTLVYYLTRYFIALRDPSFPSADERQYLDELGRYCAMKKGHLSDMHKRDWSVFAYDFIQAEEDNFKAMPEKKNTKIEFYYTPEQIDLFDNQFYLYGRSDQALGKIIARAPMKDTYRKATYG